MKILRPSILCLFALIACLSLPNSFAAESATTQSADPQVEQVVLIKLNINSADVKQLTQLEGIGKVRAQAIFDYRETHGAFASLDDLLKVNGIGKKTLKSLKEQVTL